MLANIMVGLLLPPYSCGQVAGAAHSVNDTVKAVQEEIEELAAATSTTWDRVQQLLCGCTSSSLGANKVHAEAALALSRERPHPIQSICIPDFFDSSCAIACCLSSMRWYSTTPECDVHREGATMVEIDDWS